MRQQRRRCLIATIALAVAVFGAGVPVGHAATTTTLARDYGYDRPDVFAQGGYASSLDPAAWSAPVSARLQGAFPSIRFETRIGVAAEEGADVAYHYTFREAAASIERNGLRPGSYATPNGSLSPLQAQIDLALPPNRGLMNAAVRIDLAGLRKAGYEIPEVTRVGRSFNMPGGGYTFLEEHGIKAVVHP